VKSKHWFVLVGGINGAGKSTLAQSRPFLQLFGVDPGSPVEIINPDIVTQRIREQAPNSRLDEVNLRAARVCESRVRTALRERKTSVVIETVLSTDKYKSIFRLAKRNGYRLMFIYVMLPSIKVALARVAHRVRQGGHAVSARKIRKRWPRSRAKAPWFWQHADHAMVVLNGWDGGPLPLLVAWKKEAAVWFLEDAPRRGLIAELKATRTSRPRPNKNKPDGRPLSRR
jgi:predicted ABC-type ATPase